MLGFFFLIFAFILLILGLGSYRKRRQQQRAQALYHKNNPQMYNSSYNGGFYQSQGYAPGYTPQSPPPPPMYQNSGPMEAGMVQMPPPAYDGLSRVGSKSEYNRPAPHMDAPPQKGGFRGWIRGG